MALSRPYPEGGDQPLQVIPLNQEATGAKPLPIAQPLPTQPSGPMAGRPSPAPPTQGESDKKDADDIDPIAAIVLEGSPPWLISLVFHMVMVIVMGLIVYVNVPHRPIELNAESGSGEGLDDPSELGLSGGMPNVEGANETVITPEKLPPVDDPLAAPSRLEVRESGALAASDIEAPKPGWAFRGRQDGMRQKLLSGGHGGGSGGGDGGTEAAVLKGLEWLARNQQRDGSWSLAGPFSDGVFKESDNSAAATAMALLAFQGAGNTHLEGKFKKNVANGWKWLLKQQDDTGCFFQYGNYTHRFYTHGLCAIAVCELYGMSRDAKYKQPAQKAIDYCLRTQSPQGGWRYNPNAESDVSVTGWIVMALQSARMAGLTVPAENLHKVEKFLDTAAEPDGPGYRYLPEPGESVRLSMTAEALLMRQYLGWKRDNPRLVAGVEWITSPKNLIDFKNNRNVYYWYYATQVAHHIGGAPWGRWNAVMKKVMPARQVSHGREAGSWNPHGSGDEEDDQFAGSGGRLYVTCLSIYMLEVYYRHMPLYSGVYSRTAMPLDEKVEKGAGK